MCPPKRPLAGMARSKLTALPTVSCASAVSYTHLDVYKRQVYLTAQVPCGVNGDVGVVAVDLHADVYKRQHMIKSVLEAAGRKVGMIGTNGIPGAAWRAGIPDCG